MPAEACRVPERGGVRNDKKKRGGEMEGVECGCGYDIFDGLEALEALEREV